MLVLVVLSCVAACCTYVVAERSDLNQIKAAYYYYLLLSANCILGKPVTLDNTSGKDRREDESS